jgi:hypothetical protein
MIPPSAKAMPKRLPLLNDFPAKTQLKKITTHVLKWPTTVLLTGPASLMITNWVTVIKHASPPLYFY